MRLHMIEGLYLPGDHSTRGLGTCPFMARSKNGGDLVYISDNNIECLTFEKGGYGYTPVKFEIPNPLKRIRSGGQIKILFLDMGFKDRCERAFISEDPMPQQDPNSFGPSAWFWCLSSNMANAYLDRWYSWAFRKIIIADRFRKQQGSEDSHGLRWMAAAMYAQRPGDPKSHAAVYMTKKYQGLISRAGEEVDTLLVRTMSQLGMLPTELGKFSDSLTEEWWAEDKVRDSRISTA